MGERLLGVLLDHQHGDASRAQILEQLEQLLHQDGREPDRGLVDQHQLRLEQEPAGDLQHRLLAARQRRGLRVRLAAQHRKAIHRGVEARTKVEARRRRDAAELQIVEHRQLGKDVAALRHVADAGGDQLAWRQVGDGAVLEQDAPVAHPQHAEQRLEGGRLAGAVRSDHRGDRAALHAEAQAVQDGLAAVAGDHVVEAQDVVTGQDTPRRLSDRGARCPDRPAR